MKTALLSLVAGLALVFAASTAQAGGGTKPNSTVIVTNNSGTRLAVIANPGFPDAMLEMGELKAMTKTLGLEFYSHEVRRPDDIPPAIDAMKGHADALYVCGDPLMVGNRVRLNALALAAQLPTVHSLREHVEAGGLISYGTNFIELFRHTADLVNKILRGTKPADIPVEQPTKFDLVVNLITAKALGLVVPPTLLARADKVIE